MTLGFQDYKFGRAPARPPPTQFISWKLFNASDLWQEPGSQSRCELQGDRAMGCANSFDEGPSWHFLDLLLWNEFFWGWFHNLLGKRHLRPDTILSLRKNANVSVWWCMSFCSLGIPTAISAIAVFHCSHLQSRNGMKSSIFLGLGHTPGQVGQLPELYEIARQCSRGSSVSASTISAWKLGIKSAAETFQKTHLFHLTCERGGWDVGDDRLRNKTVARRAVDL